MKAGFVSALGTWYAIAGAQKRMSVGLPIAGVLARAAIGPTARPLVCGCQLRRAPKHFVRAEWFGGDSADHRRGLDHLRRARRLYLAGRRDPFAFGVVAYHRAWSEPMGKELAGVYLHDDGRPMLGRKIKSKSQRELRPLGLVSNTTTSGRPQAHGPSER